MSPLQIECIDLFVRIAQFLGLPKSFGELFGLIFLANRPLSQDDCVAALGMSKGAASQGLKQLRALGTIKLVYVATDRKDRYLAEENLNCLIAGFVKERVQPGLIDLRSRIESLETKIAGLPDAERGAIHARLDLLLGWQRKAQIIIPTVTNLMTG